MVTHDTRTHDDPADPYRQNLELITDAIATTARDFDLEVTPATLADIRAQAV